MSNLPLFKWNIGDLAYHITRLGKLQIDNSSVSNEYTSYISIQR